MAEEWGYFAIDDEGSPAQRNVLIKDGVLTDTTCGTTSARARKAAPGRAAAAGRATSTCPWSECPNLPAGRADDPDAILAGTERGVYVKDLGGGQVNTATGDFVFGMTEAYLIEDGKITEPIREGN